MLYVLGGKAQYEGNDAIDWDVEALTGKSERPESAQMIEGLHVSPVVHCAFSLFAFLFSPL